MCKKLSAGCSIALLQIVVIEDSLDEIEFVPRHGKDTARYEAKPDNSWKAHRQRQTRHVFSICTFPSDLRI